MKKFILMFAFVAMSMTTITFLSSFEWEDMEPEEETGGGTDKTGCYVTSTYACASSPVYNAGTGKYCDFTGTYGPPIQCTEKSCGYDQVTRKCVKG